MLAMFRTLLGAPFNWLPAGTLTYAAGLAILVLCGAEWAGIDVPGFEVKGDELNWALLALGLGGLRRSVAAAASILRGRR
jgi:hypothetical protein